MNYSDENLNNSLTMSCDINSFGFYNLFEYLLFIDSSCRVNFDNFNNWNWNVNLQLKISSDYPIYQPNIQAYITWYFEAVTFLRTDQVRGCLTSGSGVSTGCDRKH